MLRISQIYRGWMAFTLLAGMLPCFVAAQTKKPGGGSGYGEVEVSNDVHHDLSKPLRTIEPVALPRHAVHVALPRPADNRRADTAAVRETATHPDLVNGLTGASTTLGFFNLAGVGSYFSGPDGSFTPATTPSDAIGAVGTTQYLQWVDDAFAVFSKSTGNALYGPAAGNTIWSGFGGPCEANNDGQPTVNFDRLASRWVVSQHAAPAGGPYYQCVAVSTTADATGTWNRYSFTVGSVNTTWENQNAKLGVWPDGYYMGFDMYNGTTFMGPKFCSLNRSQMLLGASSGIQCIQLDTEYYSPIISDLDGATTPPTGTPAYFAADDVNYYALDFWKFHVNWTDSQNTTLSFVIMLGQPTFGISCGSPCIEQPNQMTLNPHGSHVLGRMPYRNYGSYQSMVAVENAETTTTPLFYEVRVASNGDLYMYQEGELQSNSQAYRFNPSIAEDRAGNIAVAYNLSNLQTPPSQYVSTRAPGDPANTLGNETLLNPGNGSQTTPEWDARASLTVDPVDDCTFYYTQQYQPMDGTDNWSTQIENFTLAGCYVPLTLATVPAGLKLTASGSGNVVSQPAPLSTQFPVGSNVTITAPSPQSAGLDAQFVFAGWSDNGADSHVIKMPDTAATYNAVFNLEYYLRVQVSGAGGGTVAPSGGSWELYGTTVNVAAIPSPGYAFASWTGNVASPSSATTSVTMIQPQTVTANFKPLATTVSAALASQSGPQNARVWSFTLTNAGPGQANGIAINAFSLTQTAGTSCKPALVSKLPIAVGNAAPKAALTASVTIDFTGCASNALFSLSIGNTENSGASHSTQTLTSLSQ